MSGWRCTIPWHIVRDMLPPAQTRLPHPDGSTLVAQPAQAALPPLLLMPPLLLPLLPHVAPVDLQSSLRVQGVPPWLLVALTIAAAAKAAAVLTYFALRDEQLVFALAVALEAVRARRERHRLPRALHSVASAAYAMRPCSHLAMDTNERAGNGE